MWPRRAWRFWQNGCAVCCRRPRCSRFWPGEPAVADALVTLRPNVWLEGTVATLHELYVVPRPRGRGFGTGVLQRVAEAALASGRAIEINVDEGDVDAQRFYERHGFSLESDTQERAFTSSVS
jgi:GNAT superfamily N-acetyltransferase